MTRGFIPIALLSAGLLAFGLQPADAAGSGSSPRPEAAKLDGGLQLLASAAASGRPVTAQTGASTADGSATVTGGARVVNGDVLVDVYVDGSLTDAVAALKSLGMSVTATNDRAPQRLVSGWLSASKLLDATALSGTRAVRAVHAGLDAADGTDSGSVLSQGDAAHHGPQARATGTTGAGVKVGVISDSMNQVTTGLAGSQASGDLPAGVTILADDSQAGVIDEGRAMAEIIYDEAPGITQIYFSTGTVSAAGKSASINNLVAAGVKIIADDIFYLDEPMFQDGQVALAVDAAKTAGVSYFASAGNRAKQSWEGTLSLSGHGRGLRSRCGHRHGPDDWHLHQSLAVHLAAVGRAVGGRDHGPRARLLHRRSPGRGPDGHRQHHLGHPERVRGHRHRRRPAHPRYRDPASGRRRDAVHEVHRRWRAIRHHDRRVRNELERDQPGRGVCIRVYGRRGLHWATPTTPEPYSSRGPSITRLFTPAGVTHDAGRPGQAGTGRRGQCVDDGARAPHVRRYQRGDPECCGHRHAAAGAAPTLTTIRCDRS